MTDFYDALDACETFEEEVRLVREYFDDDGCLIWFDGRGPFSIEHFITPVAPANDAAEATP